jgi:hypothetical protein
VAQLSKPERRPADSDGQRGAGHDRADPPAAPWDPRREDPARRLLELGAANRDRDASHGGHMGEAAQARAQMPVEAEALDLGELVVEAR